LSACGRVVVRGKQLEFFQLRVRRTPIPIIATKPANNIAEVEIEGQSGVGKFRQRPEAPPKLATSSAESQSEAAAANSKHELLLQDFSVTLPPVDNPELMALLNEKSNKDGVRVSFQTPSDSTFTLLVLYLAVPLLLFVGLWFMLRRFLYPPLPA
jgi:ATP-dependent Zn protease